MSRIAAAVPAAIAGFALLTACSSTPTYQPGPLVNSTPCGVLTADQHEGDTADIDNYVRNANSLYAQARTDTQVQDHMVAALAVECAENPTEALSAALNKAMTEVASESLAPSSVPDPFQSLFSTP